MTAEEKFRDEMLAEIRKKFFKKVPEKQWFQERTMLVNAIALPARYLHDHGIAALPSLYRRILRTVIQTIVERGATKDIRRFSFYFVRCVDLHMKHQGEKYYSEAKGTRTAASFIDPAIRNLRNREAVQFTEVMAGVHRAVNLSSGRKKSPPPKQPELFSS